MEPLENPAHRPKLQMIHPKHPGVKIPATRLLGVGLHPAVPAYHLKPWDEVVLDYGKIYKISHMSMKPANRMQINLVRPDETTKRIVSPNTHVAVTWGTFNKRWQIQNGGTQMAGKKVKLAGKIDMRSPIKSGVSFNGTVDLTKQGGAKGKKINLGKY
jgi:hypothetical protein